MKNLIRWAAPVVALCLMTGSAVAAEAVAGGKIKGVNADKQEFVLTDAEGKDWTFKVGDDLTVNRGGKEGKSDLKAGDHIFVCYDKGVVSWTATYVLVQEGSTKNCELVNGRFKGYDESRKEVTITDDQKKDLTFNFGQADVRVNKLDKKIDDVKIGEDVVAIVAKDDGKSGKTTLKSLMVHRK